MILEKKKKTGELGEELVLEYEKKRLSELGRTDLVNSIEHVSKTQGDGTGSIQNPQNSY